MSCSRQRGFTLIELLITLALISILTAAVLNSFNEILNEQKRTQASAQVKNDLRSAQNRALSGINQETYSGWGLLFTEGSNTYNLCGRIGGPEANCHDLPQPVTLTLPQGVVIQDAPAYVVFQIITGENLIPATTIKVGLTNDAEAKWKTITVSAGGNIE